MVIAVDSYSHNVGVTVLTYSLAYLKASTKKKTVIVNIGGPTPYRNNMMAKYLNLPKFNFERMKVVNQNITSGVETSGVQYFQELDDKTAIEKNLFYFYVSEEIYTSDREVTKEFIDFINTLNKLFDYVFIDTDQIMSYTKFAKYVDKVLLVLPPDIYRIDDTDTKVMEHKKLYLQQEAVNFKGKVISIINRYDKSSILQLNNFPKKTQHLGKMFYTNYSVKFIEACNNKKLKTVMDNMFTPNKSLAQKLIFKQLSIIDKEL